MLKYMLSVSSPMLIMTVILAGCASPDQRNRDKTHYTWKDMNENNVVMQELDYSCGAAALSTYFNYYFHDDMDEASLLKDMLNNLSSDQLKAREKEGFSLLDLKHAAERRGYKAYGIKLVPSAINKLKSPILVYLETKEYKHFAILRGVVEDRVFLADPSRGNIRVPMFRFVKEWGGIALVLVKPGFGTPTEHPLALNEPIPLRNELQSARNALIK